MNCDLIESDLVFWVLLAVVFFEFLELEVLGPHDLAEV